MSPPCIVIFCNNRGTHILPTNETRKAQWIKAIEYVKPGLSFRKHSRICSAHFKPTDFNITSLYLLQSDFIPKTLKRTAVPSVFPWKMESQESPTTRHQDQDMLTFNCTKVRVTYARTPRITFVEELPYLDTTASEFTEDPLNLDVEDRDRTEPDESAPNDGTRVNIVSLIKIELDV